MKHEIINLPDMQVIGLSRVIEFNNPSECTALWGEYAERIVKPVFMEGMVPDEFQKAAVENGIGEFGLCTCDIPGHNCLTCGSVNFGGCSKGKFTYVVGGTYKGGPVPEGMNLYPVKGGKYLKVHFEGGMPMYQQQFQFFREVWLTGHTEFRIADDGCSIEWYSGSDISSPDYKCGIMLPLAD